MLYWNWSNLILLQKAGCLFVNWCLSQFQKFLFGSGWHSEDQVFPNILYCQGCFDNLKANYFCTIILFSLGRNLLIEERLVLRLLLSWLSFSFSALASAFSRLVLVELVSWFVPSKYSLGSLNEFLLSEIPFIQGEKRTVLSAKTL